MAIAVPLKEFANSVHLNVEDTVEYVNVGFALMVTGNATVTYPFWLVDDIPLAKVS